VFWAKIAQNGIAYSTCFRGCLKVCSTEAFWANPDLSGRVLHAGLHAVRQTGTTGSAKTTDGRFRQFLPKASFETEF
jgi:hypothetical protein